MRHTGARASSGSKRCGIVESCPPGLSIGPSALHHESAFAHRRFLIEQLRPLSYRGWSPIRWEDWPTGWNCAVTQVSTATASLPWLIVIVPAVLGTGILYAVSWSINPLAALVCNVGVLYLTMGFRQFSHHYTGNPTRPADWATWTGPSAVGPVAGAFGRVPGLWRRCPSRHRGSAGGNPTGTCSQSSFGTSSAWPLGAVLTGVGGAGRALAAGSGRARRRFLQVFRPGFRYHRLVCRCGARQRAFAIVGDFEDAVYCWRNQAGEVAGSRTRHCPGQWCRRTGSSARAAGGRRWWN